MANRWKFEDLLVWKKSIKIVSEIYKITRKFPKYEIYWLTSQLRRASVSIPSNIAEWNEKWSDKHFTIFLENSQGSCVEVYTQLLIAYNLWYLEKSIYDIIIWDLQEIRRMIAWLMVSLHRRL